MRVCITGGRDFLDHNKVYSTLDYAYDKKPFILISGGARGVDSLGIDWARERNVACEVHPAHWKLHGNRAGILRNIQMLKSGIDVLVAFPGGRGTSHMVMICKEAGIPVVRVK